MDSAVVQVEVVSGSECEDVALWVPRSVKDLEVEVDVLHVDLLSRCPRCLARDDAVETTRNKMPTPANARV